MNYLIPTPDKIERRVARKRSFPRSSNTSDLLVVLRGERFTGSITFHMSQGSLQAVVVEDSQVIAEPTLDRVVG